MGNAWALFSIMNGCRHPSALHSLDMGHLFCSSCFFSTDHLDHRTAHTGDTTHLTVQECPNLPDPFWHPILVDVNLLPISPVSSPPVATKHPIRTPLTNIPAVEFHFTLALFDVKPASLSLIHHTALKPLDTHSE